MAGETKHGYACVNPSGGVKPLPPKKTLSDRELCQVTISVDEIFTLAECEANELGYNLAPKFWQRLARAAQAKHEATRPEPTDRHLKTIRDRQRANAKRRGRRSRKRNAKAKRTN